jgi:type I restriction enzyme S subunit
MSVEVKPGYKQTEVGVIPEDWAISTVGAEFSIQLGKMLDAEKNVGVPKPYLGNRAVQWGRIDLADIGEIKLTPSDLQRFRLRKCDLLVCEGGEIGRAAVWQQPIEECYYQKALHRLRPIRGYNVQLMLYMLHWLASAGFLLNFVTQTSIAHLPKDKFETLPIPRPPTKAEQEAIAEALSDVDALLGALDRLIAKKRDLKQAAMQQLLTGQTRLPGFRGEWKETTLGQIGECIIGLTYKPENVVEHGLLVLRSSNVQNGGLAYEDNVHVNLEVAEHLYTRPGDILVCVRNGSRALIGKCAVIDEAAAGVTFGAFMSVFRTKHWRFIVHAFQSEDIQRQIRDNIGATINQITNKDMKAFCVRLPSEEEQTAIAAVLSDMDAELSALEARRDKTRALKQAMMQELFTGRTRLIPHDATRTEVKA